MKRRNLGGGPPGALRETGGRTMRRWGISFLLLTLLLSGCGGQSAVPAAAPDGASAPERPAVEARSASPVADMSSSLLEHDPRPLPEEEILTAYQRAAAMYGWFSVDLLPDSGETARVEGRTYRKVDMPGMEDLDDLRTFLRSAFSKELTERLLATGGERPVYREIDGALYVSGENRPRAEHWGDVSVEVQQDSGTEYSVNVCVEHLDADGVSAGVECWSFRYVYEDDRWVFPEFQLVS